MTDRELATAALTALATSDIDRVRELTGPDVVVFGTDQGERWDNRSSLIDALEEMRALGLTADWDDDLRQGPGWIAGTAIYRFSRRHATADQGVTRVRGRAPRARSLLGRSRRRIDSTERRAGLVP